VWCLYNICPFDLIFKISRFPVCKFVLSFFAGFAQRELIIHSKWVGSVLLEDNFLKQFLILVLSHLMPFFINLLDNQLFDYKSKSYFYSFAYFKREFAGLIFIFLISEKKLYYPETPLSSLYVLIPYFAIIFAFVKMADFLVHRGNPWEIFDMVLPSELFRPFLL
jgi:hypothetical protein